jgi:acetyl-CoA carboxylase biotin carboxyl carrier protein
MDIDIEQIRELMRSLQEFDVREIELENDGERIVLRRGPGMPDGLIMSSTPAQMTSTPSIPPPAPVASAPIAEADDPNVVYVTSPFVGTFYRSPTPDADNFVKPGERIEPGQVLCIVEAMKLMNEIEAELSGTLLEVLVDNGKPVEYGDRLFKVKKA